MKLVLIILLLHCVHLNKATSCPNGFQNINSNCYHFSNETATFYEALDRCIEMKASLLSVETIQENFALKLHLYYKDAETLQYWTSGSDVLAQLTWMSTLDSVVYTDWCNNANFVGGLCVFISHTTLAKATCWNKQSCEALTLYICEYENKEIICDCPVCSTLC